MAAAEDAAAGRQGSRPTRSWPRSRAPTTQVAAQKADYDQQLQARADPPAGAAGRPQRLRPVGAPRRPPRRRAARAAAEKAAREAAAAAASAREQRQPSGSGGGGGGGGGGATTCSRPYGRVSSCFGCALGRHRTPASTSPPRSERRSTPPRAASVQRAGPATGFGLAVYIRGDDGAVTVYGHVNRYFVAAGRAGVAPASRSPRSATAASRPARTCTSRCTPAASSTANQINPVPWLQRPRRAPSEAAVADRHPGHGYGARHLGDRVAGRSQHSGVISAAIGARRVR